MKAHIELLKRAVEQIERESAVAKHCGGTVSSRILRDCLDLRERLSYAGVNSSYVQRIDVVIEVWREALRRHNSQLLKLKEYNVETGLPIKKT